MSKTPSVIARGPITQLLLDTLSATGHPVGDNAAPTTPYGWQGEPGGDDSYFIPWMTLTPGASRQQRLAGSLGDTRTEWILPYSVMHAGVSRSHSEALADRIRDDLVAMSRTSVTTEHGNYRIQQVENTSIGSNNRIGSTFPDYYTQADMFEVWVTKEK